MRAKGLPQSKAGRDGKGLWGRNVEDKTVAHKDNMEEPRRE